MATPIVLITGSSSGAGTPGQDKVITAGETVTLSDTEAANVAASYQWSILDAPIGSTVTLVGDTTPTPTFVAPPTNVAGTVRFRCLVNGVDSAVRHAAVLLPNTSSRVPAFQEKSGENGWNAGGNTLGWHEAQTTAMRAFDAAAGGADDAFQLIETQTVSGFPVSSVEFTLLDGNTDGIYKIVIDWKGSGANARMILKPNGLTTTQASCLMGGGGAPPFSETFSRMVVARSPNAIDMLSETLFTAENGRPRKAVWSGGSANGTGLANQRTFSGWAFWNDIFTNVTSIFLEVVDGGGVVIPNSILSGTVISLYKVKR